MRLPNPDHLQRLQHPRERNNETAGLAFCWMCYVGDQALRNEVAQTNAQNNSALVEPELARRKEPLEAVPLDTMTLLGNITQAGRLVALIKVDSLLYQIKLGAYLGQNYGKVIKITETEVTLREIVQDAAGTWVERMQTLTLQERGK